MSKYIITFNANGEAEFYEPGTLAQRLDSRKIAVGEPSINNLPKSISSLQFLMENLIGNNCAIVKVKHSEMLYSTELLSLTQRLISPEQYVFYFIEVDDIAEDVNIDNASITTSSCQATSATCLYDIVCQTSALITELPGNC